MRTFFSPSFPSFPSRHSSVHPSIYSFIHLADAGDVQGVLAGYDQKSNVVLSDSKERIYSIDEGVEEVPLGLYLVKGDMMCVARSFSALLPTPLPPQRPPFAM